MDIDMIFFFLGMNGLTITVFSFFYFFFWLCSHSVHVPCGWIFEGLHRPRCAFCEWHNQARSVAIHGSSCRDKREEPILIFFCNEGEHMRRKRLLLTLRR